MGKEFVADERQMIFQRQVSVSVKKSVAGMVMPFVKRLELVICQ